MEHINMHLFIGTAVVVVTLSPFDLHGS